MKEQGGAPSGNRNASKKKRSKNSVLESFTEKEKNKTIQGNSRAYSIARVKTKRPLAGWIVRRGGESRENHAQGSRLGTRKNRAI